MHFLEGLYHRYGRKIWLTEFSCPATEDASVIEAYMRDVIPMLEKAEVVFRHV